MKTAIITGVTGQDGHYLAKYLLEKRYKVVGTVRSYRFVNKKYLQYLGIDKEIILEEVDLLDFSNIAKLILKYKPDAIYNLAAQSSVELSFEQSIGTFTFNTASVNNLLEAIRLLAPKIRLYQASSGEMYGKVKYLPVSLDTPMHPVSPYGVSKMAAHFMCVHYRESYGLFVSNGIMFNHESFLRSENFFIKKVIRSAIAIKNKKLDKLIVGNLHIKRDFGYAPNYVKAMWKMLQIDEPNDFIICSGVSVKLREIVEYVFDKFNLDKKLIIEDRKLYRPNEIIDIYGDNSKAKEKLGWNYDLTIYDLLDKLIEEELSSYDLL